MFKHSSYLIFIAFILLGCGGGSDSIGSKKTPPATPITPEVVLVPEATYRDSYSVEVHGEKGAKVYVDGKEVSTLKSNGKALIDLNTSGDYGSIINFEISLRDDTNVTLNDFNISIEKKKAVTTRLDAIKLLRQASFTSYETQIDEVMLNGEMAWIDKQLATKGAHDDLNDDNYGYLERLLRGKFDINDTVTLYGNHQPRTARQIIEDPEMNFPSDLSSIHHLEVFHRGIFQERMFESEDQLRQRVALAMSEIIVIAGSATAGSALTYKPETLIKLYDEFYKHSFGNYRDVLKETCMSSGMAYYLTYLGNKKENNVKNTAPDENFARELMQLFSIGIYELNLDGTKKIGDDGYPIASYTQEDVSEMAKVFTGWDWWFNGAYGNTYGNQIGNNFNLLHDLEFTETWHDKEEKHVLKQTIAAGKDGEADIDAAIDILMDNPNMAPHISRHFIMRLVTSNPSPAYIERVATAFNIGGDGNLKAMVEAILKDDEARGVTEPTDFGKVDTMLLAFTHYVTRFNGKAASFLYPSSTGGRVYNLYNYKFDLWIPNLPLTAPGVFNFYTNEDAPADSYFSDNDLVAPEIGVHAYANIKRFMDLRENPINGARHASSLYDFYEEVNLNGTSGHHNDLETIEEWLDSRRPNLGLFMNARDVYEEFLPLWYVDDSKKPEAVSKLIDLLSMKLLGKELPVDYKAKIYEEYKDATGKPIPVFRGVTRLIVTSPYFMVLD